MSFLCFVSCVASVFDGACAALGDSFLCFLVLSWEDESSESVADDSLDLVHLADGYLPCGGLCISGSCCFGHILCHSGGDMCPSSFMSVNFHSSPMFFCVEY